MSFTASGLINSCLISAAEGDHQPSERAVQLLRAEDDRNHQLSRQMVSLLVLTLDEFIPNNGQLFPAEANVKFVVVGGWSVCKEDQERIFSEVRTLSQCNLQGTLTVARVGGAEKGSTGQRRAVTGSPHPGEQVLFQY